MDSYLCLMHLTGGVVAGKSRIWNGKKWYFELNLTFFEQTKCFLHSHWLRFWSLLRSACLKCDCWWEFGKRGDPKDSTRAGTLCAMKFQLCIRASVRSCLLLYMSYLMDIIIRCHVDRWVADLVVVERFFEDLLNRYLFVLDSANIL